MESNVLSKSGFGIEIGWRRAEVPLLSHRKTSKIASFRKNQKNQNFYIFTYFHWKLYFGSFLIKINRNQSKNIKKIIFKFFRFFQEVAILLVLRWESSGMSAQNLPISIPKPVLEKTLNFTMRLSRWKRDLRTF